MSVRLEPFQKTALSQLGSGKILAGEMGSGKSLVSIYWYLSKCCKSKESHTVDGKTNLQPPKGSPNLYIITTAKKRDSLEWQEDLVLLNLYSGDNPEMGGVKVTIDSWNNIKRYEDVTDSVFIFDEQRVVGWGAWSKTFVHIAQQNRWLLLSGTPGDTWSDYIPVFIANGFYKNKSEFEHRHAVYSRFSKYPKIDRWLEEGHLMKLRRYILVPMKRPKEIAREYHDILVGYDHTQYQLLVKDRWNIFTEKPIRNYSEMAMCTRRLVNSNPQRIKEEVRIIKDHPRVIIFYNLNSELEQLRTLKELTGRAIFEWNGHKHEPVPTGDSWIYLVQYAAGSEGWNCTQTDTVIFHSLNYSYKTMKQATGRIDRMNTPYRVLHYYIIRSNSPIDKGITKALKNKQQFNAISFFKGESPDGSFTNTQ